MSKNIQVFISVCQGRSQAQIGKNTPKFQLFPVLVEQSFISNSRNDDKLTQMESKKITEMRDPLFVITTSLKIMKHQSIDSELNPEIKRMETALSRIEKIIR